MLKFILRKRLRNSFTSSSSKVCQVVHYQEDTHRSLAAFFTNTKINQKPNDGESQNTEGWNLKSKDEVLISLKNQLTNPRTQLAALQVIYLVFSPHL